MQQWQQYPKTICNLVQKVLAINTCQALREKGKSAESTSYMWIYLTGSDGLAPIILYDYAQGRAGNYARDFLEGFTGLLQCDGYQGYNKVADVILVCCPAHCRNSFWP